MSRELLTAEQAFVGCLMWLPPAEAEKAHGLVEIDDFECFKTRKLHELIGRLAHAGVQATPLACYLEAVSADSLPTPTHHHNFTAHSTRLYDDPDIIGASVRYYAGKTLEATVRRRTREMTTRLGQILDTADMDELARLTDLENNEIAEVRGRLHRLLDVPTLPWQAAA